MSDSPIPSGSARPTRALDIVSVAFVALLLISNIAATKAFMLGTSTQAPETMSRARVGRADPDGRGLSDRV